MHAIHHPSFQKRNGSREESSHGGGEAESAGAAFGGILLRNPQRIHSEVRAAEAEDRQTCQKPFERAILQIIRVAEAQRDRNEHQEKIDGKGPASAVSL